MNEDLAIQDQQTNPLPIVLIVGPTAGGKTTLAIELANRLPEDGGEIVSADSMQVYKGMDIGTAKPTPEEQARAPHHLIDIVEPDEAFTVDDWRVRAEACINEIRARNKWPIVVGGTNLYVRVLLEGMFDGPPSDQAFRESLEGVDVRELHERLRAIDPDAAERIHTNDRKRITRALEVHHTTGRPISEWQTQWEEAGPLAQSVRNDAIIIGLDWPAEAINARINARVKTMMEAGFLGEVERLEAENRLGRQTREALGYKQLLAHLHGRCELDEAIERIKIETRRFARKQRTWLRRFRMIAKSRWFPAAELETQDIVKQALTFILEHQAD